VSGRLSSLSRLGIVFSSLSYLKTVSAETSLRPRIHSTFSQSEKSCRVC